MTAILILCSVIAFQQENVDWGRPYFGLSFQPLNDDSRKELKTKLEEKFKAPSSRVSLNVGQDGMIVEGVATKVEGIVNKLEPLDVIKKIAGVEVKDVDQAIELLAAQEPGVPIDFEIMRPSFARNRVSFSKQIVQCTAVSEYLNVVSNYSVTEDEFKGRTFYKSIRQGRNAMMIYIGKTEDNEFYEVVRFRSNDIIGLRMVEVLVNGENFRFENTLQEKLDNTIIGRDSYQWFDRPVSELGDLLKKIETSTSVKLRLRGRAVVEDFDMGEAIISNIKRNRDLISALKWKEAQEK